MVENPDRNHRLGESYRQARRETVVILIIWVCFFAWTGLVCATTSRLAPGEAVPTLLGLPRWVVLGVVVPWVLACGVTAWFALGFMKDTELDPDEGQRKEEA